MRTETAPPKTTEHVGSSVPIEFIKRVKKAYGDESIPTPELIRIALAKLAGIDPPIAKKTGRPPKKKA